MSKNKVDLAIIGGGMVGASLACALANPSLKIALIDGAPVNLVDHRLIALTYSSYCLFKNLNLWDELAPYATPIQQVHVSDRGRFNMLRLQANDLKLPALGYVVPATHINNALYKHLETTPSIQLIRSAHFKKINFGENLATIVYEKADQEIQLDATLIIGADGSNSTVREQLGIITETIDEKQSALVTITQLQRDHYNIAYERFHASGALAMLPLAEQKVATIWTDNNAVISDLMKLDDRDFLRKIQDQFGYRLGRLLQTQQRFVYPLKMIKAKHTLKKNILLVGNAAHTFSPIAAQGLNLALSEVAMLAQTLGEQQRSAIDRIDWQPFLSWQQKQQTTSGRFSLQLPWLFTQDVFPIKLARQIGMMGLDICPPAKRGFILKALGRHAKLPPLLYDPDEQEIFCKA